jgi:hypothetical protein
MKFEDVPVRPVMRYTLCDCGGRLLQEDGAVVWLSSPPQYPHQCEKCRERKSLRSVSPSLIWEAV